jgi:CHAT domain-containing protein
MLPFDSFLKSNPATDCIDFEGLHYLIYDYALSFEYSSSLIFGKQDQGKTGSRIYTFIPGYGKINELDNLPGASNESEAIFKLFRGKSFAGSEASESHFREAIRNPGIFHLAMHSLADSSNSKYSYMMFDTRSDTLNDGKLYNYEISLSRIVSPMVVLSACNSGTGNLYHAEGLMSIARGFMLAGASSVIKTGWAVNDETSASIITRFYYHLSKGKPKDKALRLAKLEFIKRNPPIYSNPYYWAAYEVLGDNSGLRRNNIKFIILTITLSCVLVSVLIIIYLNRRRIFFARSL